VGRLGTAAWGRILVLGACLFFVAGADPNGQGRVREIVLFVSGAFAALEDIAARVAQASAVLAIRAQARFGRIH